MEPGASTQSKSASFSRDARGTRPGKYLLNVGFVVACAALLSGCFSPTYRCRYKLRIVVNVAGQEYVGESVRETSYKDPQDWFPSEGGLIVTQRGEATVVKLPGGRLLVAIGRGINPLPPSRDIATWPWDGTAPLRRAYGFGPQEWSGGRSKALQEFSKLHSGPPVPIADSDLPVLLSFKNPADPKTLFVVNPKDLSGVAADARLVSVAVQPTAEPLFQERIEAELPWVPAVLAAHGGLDGKRRSSVDSTKFDILQELSGDDFKFRAKQ